MCLLTCAQPFCFKVQTASRTIFFSVFGTEQRSTAEFNSERSAWLDAILALASTQNPSYGKVRVGTTLLNSMTGT